MDSEYMYIFSFSDSNRIKMRADYLILSAFQGLVSVENYEFCAEFCFLFKILYPTLILLTLCLYGKKWSTGT